MSHASHEASRYKLKALKHEALDEGEEAKACFREAAEWEVKYQEELPEKYRSYREAIACFCAAGERDKAAALWQTLSQEDQTEMNLLLQENGLSPLEAGSPEKP